MISFSYTNATEDDFVRSGRSCTICWQLMKNARKLPCGHVFHELCLRRYQSSLIPTNVLISIKLHSDGWSRIPAARFAEWHCRLTSTIMARWCYSNKAAAAAVPTRQSSAVVLVMVLSAVKWVTVLYEAHVAWLNNPNSIDNALQYVLEAFSPHNNRLARWWTRILFETMNDEQVCYYLCLVEILTLLPKKSVLYWYLLISI